MEFRLTRHDPKAMFLIDLLSKETQNPFWDSLLRRGSKVFFSGGVDPLSNVSAGTELQSH